MCCATSVVKEQETWTESWTTGATARLVRSSCGARHTSSNVQLQARTTERDGVRELQGPYLLFIIWLPFQKSPKYQSLPPSPLPKPAPCFLCNKTHCFRKSTNQHQEPIKQFWWLWRHPIWRRKQLYDTSGNKERALSPQFSILFPFSHFWTHRRQYSDHQRHNGTSPFFAQFTYFTVSIN